MPSNCVFCAIVQGDAPAERIVDDERTVAFMDINPATRGHVLVIPKTHCRDITDADPDDVAAVAQTAQRLAQAAFSELAADGVNLIQASGTAAFQTVFHMHFHVIPRYGSDGLLRPWTPVPGNADEIQRRRRLTSTCRQSRP
jgi:histidine triad (HIT) family protein